jgi:hypothetical protein
MTDALQVSSVNRYLAHKQHLLPASHLADVVQVTRDIVALHATNATSPYLSLWARVPDFQRGMLEETLYERRTLAKLLCMRVTLHLVPSDEVFLFFQAYSEHRTRPEVRGFEELLVQEGFCQEQEVDAYLAELQHRVLDVLAEKGPSTVRQINQAVPELKAKSTLPSPTGCRTLTWNPSPLRKRGPGLCAATCPPSARLPSTTSSGGLASQRVK